MNNDATNELNYATNNSNYMQIIKSMDYLLKTKKLKNITIREICQTANLSVGTFYHYFRSKDDVLVAKNSMENERIAKELRYKLFDLHPYDQVIQFSTEYLNMNIAAGLEQTSSLFVPGIASYAPRQPIVIVLEEIIANGQQRGFFSTNLNKTNIAELIMSILRGCVCCWCMEQGNFDLIERGLFLTRIFLQSLISPF